LKSCFRLAFSVYVLKRMDPTFYGSRYTITSVSCPSLTCVWVPSYDLTCSAIPNPTQPHLATR
jgi:hypothetical protein